MKLPHRAKAPDTRPPRRIHTRLAGVFVLVCGLVLISPFADGWYAYMMPVAWFGYAAIPFALSIIAFPDWWETHRD